jgi:ribosome-binding factor A
MATRRQKRLEGVLRDEIGRIIRREMGDMVTPLMSITAVEVAKDLSVAKVFVSFLEGQDSKSTLAKLEKAGGFIRSKLNKVLRMRRIPKLYFRLDETIAKAFRIEEVISRVMGNESVSSDDSEEDK